MNKHDSCVVGVGLGIVAAEVAKPLLVYVCLSLSLRQNHLFIEIMHQGLKLLPKSSDASTYYECNKRSLEANEIDGGNWGKKYKFMNTQEYKLHYHCYSLLACIGWVMRTTSCIVPNAFIVYT